MSRVGRVEPRSSPSAPSVRMILPRQGKSKKPDEDAERPRPL